MIWIDDRIGSRDLEPILHARPGIPCSLSRLEFGDACWLGEGPDGPILCGMERKALSDLCQSCRTGRLGSYQLPGLVASYDRVYLIVEGMFRADNDGYIEHLTKEGRWRRYLLGSQPVYYREMFDHWVDWQEHFGVTTYVTLDKYHTAEVVYDLARQWAKPYGYRQRQAEKIGIKQVPLRSRALHMERPGLLQRMLAQISAVGPDLSLAIVQHFHTMEAVLAADPAQWREVPGIGKVLAERIWKEMRSI